MATTVDYMEFVMDQLSILNFEFRYRKMFGEYCVYANDKPIFLVCDNVVYVKMAPYLEEIMKDAEVAKAYPGSKDFYILDVDNKLLLRPVVELLEFNTLVPVKKVRRKKS